MRNFYYKINKKIRNRNDEKDKEQVIIKKKLKYEEALYQFNMKHFLLYYLFFFINYIISKLKINKFSLIYMIICILIYIPETWLLNSFSIRITLFLSAS